MEKKNNKTKECIYHAGVTHGMKTIISLLIEKEIISNDYLTDIIFYEHFQDTNYWENKDNLDIELLK